MSSRALPGSSGLPLVGETLPFLRDIKHFIDQRIAKHGPVFRTNILGSTTAFSCGYASTLNVLLPESDRASATKKFDAAEAYSEFMASLYPSPNLLLSPDTHPVRTKANLLLNRLLVTNLPVFVPMIRGIARSQIDELCTQNPSSLRLYSFFKSLTERIVTTVVLGNLEREEYHSIRKLCSLHFKGIVAAPVHIDALGARSARASATHAYEELTGTLRLRLEECVNSPSESECVLAGLARELKTGGQEAEEVSEMVQLLLVLLSTAVPKALASGLCSAVHALSRPSHKGLQNRLVEEWITGKTDLVDKVLMETLRLFPPLPGGMRQSNGARVGGCVVPKRWRVWYSALHSNRDEEAYESATEFLPERWNGLRQGGVGCPFARPGEDASVRTPLTFGAGERHCKGRDLGWAIMREVLGGLLQRFAIEKRTQNELELRFVPVLRPSNDEAVAIKRR